MNKQVKGGQANVDLVAGSRNVATLRRVGLECVRSYLQREQAAFCKVFGVQSDYLARDRHHRGDSECWIWYVGVPLVGGDPIVTRGDSLSYDADHCPGKVYAPLH